MVNEVKKRQDKRRIMRLTASYLPPGSFASYCLSLVYTASTFATPFVPLLFTPHPSPTLTLRIG